MPSFAIKRWDGEVHVVQAASVEDAGNRYGWPGNGTIEPFDAAQHGDAVTAKFETVEEHAAFLASDKYQSEQVAKVAKADKEAIAAAKAAADKDADKADDKGSK